MRTKPLAQLINVCKVFSSGNQTTLAVNDVSLDFFDAEMVLLLGPSGSGKTTLLTTLAGLLSPTSGNVMLFGKSVTAYTHAELQQIRAAKIGFIFQTFMLLDALTVSENISIVTRFVRSRRNGVDSKMSRLLQRLNIAHLAQKYPRELSQGEKQRVAIARAVINEPDVIIADEPTASVDAVNGATIIHLLNGFTKVERKCVIVTSHDQRLVDYADRVVEMEDGRARLRQSGCCTHHKPVPTL